MIGWNRREVQSLGHKHPVNQHLPRARHCSPTKFYCYSILVTLSLAPSHDEYSPPAHSQSGAGPGAEPRQWAPAPPTRAHAGTARCLPSTQPLPPLPTVLTLQDMKAATGPSGSSAARARRPGSPGGAGS